MGDHDQNTLAQRTAKIRELNDILRKRGERGRILLTPGITALSPPALNRMWKAIREFDDFSPANDPYGEGDFGQIVLPGEEPIFWKIDYFDVDLEGGSPDPADWTVTCRILTLMLASEY